MWQLHYSVMPRGHFYGVSIYVLSEDSNYQSKPIKSQATQKQHLYHPISLRILNNAQSLTY